MCVYCMYKCVCTVCTNATVLRFRMYNKDFKAKFALNDIVH